LTHRQQQFNDLARQETRPEENEEELESQQSARTDQPPMDLRSQIDMFVWNETNAPHNLNAKTE